MPEPCLTAVTYACFVRTKQKAYSLPEKVAVGLLRTPLQPSRALRTGNLRSLFVRILADFWCKRYKMTNCKKMLFLAAFHFKFRQQPQRRQLRHHCGPTGEKVPKTRAAAPVNFDRPSSRCQHRFPNERTTLDCVFRRDCKLVMPTSPGPSQPPHIIRSEDRKVARLTTLFRRFQTECFTLGYCQSLDAAHLFAAQCWDRPTETHTNHHSRLTFTIP